MRQHGNTKTVAQTATPGIRRTNIAVPMDVWMAVKTEALKRAMPAQQIWVEAARAHLNLEAPEGIAA